MPLVAAVLSLGLADGSGTMCTKQSHTDATRIVAKLSRTHRPPGSLPPNRSSHGGNGRTGLVGRAGRLRSPRARAVLGLAVVGRSRLHRARRRGCPSAPLPPAERAFAGVAVPVTEATPLAVRAGRPSDASSAAARRRLEKTLPDAFDDRLGAGDDAPSSATSAVGWSVSTSRLAFRDTGSGSRSARRSAAVALAASARAARSARVGAVLRLSALLRRVAFGHDSPGYERAATTREPWPPRTFTPVGNGTPVAAWQR